jgi:outer membrane immunogenic protein
MKTSNYLSFGLASALAFAAALPAANAADINRDRGSYKDTGPVDYAPYITWTGFYVGAHVGAAFSDNEDVEIVDDAAFLAGAHLGYNWQGPSNIVLGIEGDVSFLDEIDYLATVRGRLGYAFGPTLAYVTGGAAFIGFDENLAGDDSDTGWVAGVGLERKLRPNVSIGAEALYYGFENDNSGGDDNNFWTARARLTYHLNGGRGGDLK